MVRSITCNVLHMRQFCRFLYCLASFETVEFNRLPCPNDKMDDDVVFADWFRNQLTMFGIRILIWLSRLIHAHIAYETDTAKSPHHSAEFPIVCMTWYGWIHSSATLTRQDVRWCSFRRSIAISISYVWNVYIDLAISTRWYSYCIWNRYIQNHH